MAEHPPGLDLDTLAGYLNTHRPGMLDGPLDAELVAGGRSNLTYIVRDGTHSWVVRRPPLGHVLATAHDMSREYRVITALGPTSVPVPHTVLLCEDTEVLGAPFYVMEHVPGVPYRTDDQLAGLGPDRTRSIALSAVDTLVELHAVDPVSVGLGDFGRPDGFLERQVRRWSKQLEASRSREVPGIDELRDRLGARIPEPGPGTIVHGDYRLDNMLVDDADRITAVLDWEMCTLGDPLTDLGLLLVYDDLADLGTENMVSTTAAAPGYPSAAEITGRYAAASGRDLSNLDWYMALGFFKLAVVLEGIYYRFSHGQTVGEGFDRIGDTVGPLVSRGRAKLDTFEES